MINLWFLMMIGARQGGSFGLVFRMLLTVIAAGVILALLFCPFVLFPWIKERRA
jgi:hypothetical protein